LHGQDLKRTVQVVDDPPQQRTEGGGSVAVDESREEFLGLRVKKGIFPRMGTRHRIGSFPGSGSRFPFSSVPFFYTIRSKKSNGKSTLQNSGWEANREWRETARKDGERKKGFPSILEGLEEKSF
jgi:hypothetical protein